MVQRSIKDLETLFNEKIKNQVKNVEQYVNTTEMKVSMLETKIDRYIFALVFNEDGSADAYWIVESSETEIFNKVRAYLRRTTKEYFIEDLKKQINFIKLLEFPINIADNAHVMKKLKKEDKI